MVCLWEKTSEINTFGHTNDIIMRIVYNNMSEHEQLQQRLDAIHEEIDDLRAQLHNVESRLTEEEKNNIREDMRMFKRHVNSTRKRLHELSVAASASASPPRQRRRRQTNSRGSRGQSRGGRKTRRFQKKR